MESILEALAQYGIAGIFLAVLVYYLNKLTDIHRQERAEWAQTNDRHVEKFSQVIEKNTDALTAMRIELNNSKCKA
jgi:hypothetical protein